MIRKQPLSFSTEDPPQPAVAPADAAAVDAQAEPAPDVEPDSDLEIAPRAPETPLAPRPASTALTARTRASAPPSGGGRAMAAAIAVSVVWAAGLAAFVIGYQRQVGPFALEPFAIGLFVLLCLAPVGFFLICARALAQARRLTGETARAQALADEMLVPAASAAAEAGSAVEAVRRQIEEAAAVARDARETMLALREALAMETDRLAQAASGSVRTARELAETLGRERSQLDALSTVLSDRASAVTEAIGSQARMVAEASDLAETQLREAEALLAARAADLAAAAGEASDAARTAGDEIGRQALRLETAGAAVGDQMRVVEQEISQQRAALVTVAHALRADHDDFAAQTESRVAQLAEFVNHARMGASEMGDAALEGGRQLASLVDTASAHFHAAAEQARAERDSSTAAFMQSLEAFAAAAAEQRHALEEAMRESVQGMGSVAEQARDAVERQADRVRTLMTEQRQTAYAALQEQIEAATKAAQESHAAVERQVEAARAIAEQQKQAAEAALRDQVDALAAAAEEARQVVERQAEIARVRVDQLSEAAFVAGQRADNVFEARLNDARDLIDRSAALVEQAGAQTVQKLEAGLGSARDMLQQLEQLLAEVGERTESLPMVAHEKAMAVKAEVERGVEDLMNAAQRTAEQTQAIDAAFQDRIKKNYEMLSEAVRLMGVAAGPSQGGGALSALRAPIGAPPPIMPPPSAAAPAPADAPESAEQAGLRPRLRLTPTATDEEFKSVFDAAGGRREPDSPMGWKDLLSTMDPKAPPSAAPPVGDRLAREIEIMGIDPMALLPRVRIEEVAAAVQTGDFLGAREVVRSLAPAAVRRLTRRLFSDQPLAAQAEQFVRLYAEMLEKSAAQDRSGYMVSQMLGTPAGRAFLLIDSASGDLR